jgi:microcystin-dependent protein
MSEQYIAEIRAFGFNFAPIDWAQCNGQIIGIDQNTTLFNIIGTTYGGNGTSTFGLPNLQDRTPVGMGQQPGFSNWPLGALNGTPNVTLNINQVPLHGHTMTAGVVSTAEYITAPSANVYPGHTKSGQSYSLSSTSTMASAAVGVFGGSLPHDNVQPVLVLNFCIALYGVYPPQS